MIFTAVVSCKSPAFDINAKLHGYTYAHTITPTCARTNCLSRIQRGSAASAVRTTRRVKTDPMSEILEYKLRTDSVSGDIAGFDRQVSEIWYGFFPFLLLCCWARLSRSFRQMMPASNRKFNFYTIMYKSPESSLNANFSGLLVISTSLIFNSDRYPKKTSADNAYKIGVNKSMKSNDNVVPIS